MHSLASEGGEPNLCSERADIGKEGEGKAKDGEEETKVMQGSDPAQL